ncbi:hypothetical protein AYI69_g41 [Smittium culicis]|uniref:Uncharacterized protein n=1 Tax=Smittium culicis TaxID=133412 RepID=A0A1R1YU41_9FUNG|nr:hypothetical protein AYI69_g41 [Smittium culicis]
MIFCEHINNTQKENLLTELKANEKEIVNKKKEILDGIIIKSRSIGYEKNERSNKFFFGLFKSREKK